MSEKSSGESDESEFRSWPLPGDPDVVFVSPRAGCGIQIIRIALAAAPLVLCCGGVGAGADYLFGRVFGEPDGALGGVLTFLSVAIALAVTAFMAWVFVVPVRAPYKRALIVVSPVGIEMQDHHFDVHTRLRWEDVIGVAKVTAPNEAPCAASPTQATIDTDPRLPADGYGVVLNQGIIGWAEQDFPERLPKPWESIARVQKINTATGKRQAAIPLSLGGTNNPNNPIIRYLLHYCPHLFHGPPTLGSSAHSA
jgi:hypothetical protein